MEKFMQYLPIYGLPIVWALLIFFVGKIVAKLISKLVGKGLNKSNTDITLVKFIQNIVYVILMAVVIIAALDKLGVETTSFAAMIAAAGLAIGLAFKDSLSNFSSGIMLIIFKPFKVADFVEVAGQTGVIEEIQIFTTKLRTGDNKSVIIPNSKITDSNIVNYSAKATRRIDMVIGVSYEDDLKKVKAVLKDILLADERILTEPEPTIGLLELADSSVNFAVRPWVKTEDYWPVLFDTQEAIKLRFDAEGISIPYPQQDVHITQQQDS